jgi:hypothetical protein
MSAPKKKKIPKKPAVPPIPSPKSPKNSARAKSNPIPEEVSQRMVRRMALFSGIPTALGMSSFFISYWIVKQEWFKLPTAAVALVSFGLFGLGVIGLSYGIFSTSWDEERPGGWFGWQEFTTNFGRTAKAWRTAKKETQGS